MLVADTLTADLTFYENGETSSEWSATQALRGVTEGDATRYALARREPLLIELEAFRDLVAGDDDAHVVSLGEGLEARRLRRGGARERREWRDGAPGGRGRRRLMRVVVVALGKIGLPLAAPSPAPGTRSSAATSTSASSSS